MIKIMDSLKPPKQKVANVSVLVMATNEDFIEEAIRLQNPKKNVSNFHGAMKNILTFAQIFGMMPVYGIRDPSIDYLEFKWVSLKTFYSIIGVFAVMITGILYFLEFLREEMDFGFLVSTVYYLCQTCGYALFIQLAMKWLVLNKEWLKMEQTMARYSYQPNDHRRFKITAIVIMSLATVEHIFSIMKSYHLVQSCPLAKTEPMKAYFGLCCTNVFSITSYAIWKALLTEIPIILATIHWSFLDTFLIICSAAMAERFKQINKQISSVVKTENQQFWREIREDYTQLWNLCRTLDNLINKMVTLSFASNLFFICWQMFNSLKPKRDAFHTLYFLFSFGFLLGRTGTVSVYCCWINDESKDILTSLFNIPQKYFCLEADRLINQICSSPAALTGSNFFAVTRGLCLQVASAIITFEIILVQMGPSFLKTDAVKPLSCIP